MPLTPCTVPECDRTAYARGQCERHYRQVLRRGTLAPERVTSRTCRADPCERAAVTRGWCHAHYLRWVRTGEVRANEPLQGRGAPRCSVDGCPNRNHARGLCSTHLRRLQVLGDAAADVPIRRTGVEGYVHRSGYRVVPVPRELRHLTAGVTNVLEQRLVMAVLLGRPLLQDEVVHHLNGDRLDNRPTNLELWSTAQPKGQRAADKVAYALEVLRRYAPGALSEAGQAESPLS